MPWKKVDISVRTGDGVGEQTYEECPLGKFQVNRDSGGPGFYNGDPVEACVGCNFADTSKDRIEEACMCPADMTREEYEELKEDYLKAEPKPTKTGFWEYVNKRGAEA